MKLDFSALAQPAAKARGQVGTTGTPASTRVCASPLAQPGAGTTGDKPVALVADLVVAVPVACPPVSPACPQVTDAEKLNAGAVSPASPLVPVEAAQVAKAATFEREDEAGKSTGAGINTCVGCLHLLRRGTCGEPVAAGLLTAAEGFGIAWPPEGHGAICQAFGGRMAATPVERPYRLAQAAADAAHAEAWDDGAIARFRARAAAIQGRGFTEQDAGDLAEALHLRDVHADFRHLCLECKHLGGRVGAWRCGNHKVAGLHAADVGPNLAAMLQHCPGFAVQERAR